MKSWIKGILVLVLAVGVVGGMVSQAFAVYGDGAGHGGQFKGKNGNPVAGVKVKITRTFIQFTEKNGEVSTLPNVTTRTDETETDDRGFFYLPPGGGEAGG